MGNVEFSAANIDKLSDSVHEATWKNGTSVPPSSDTK